MTCPAPARRTQALMDAYAVRARYAIDRSGEEPIDLTRGYTAFVTPEHIREAAVRAIRDGHTDYEDVLSLREAIADKLAADNDIHVDPVTGIQTGAGAHLLLFDVMQTFVDPGDEVILGRPGQPTYYHYNTIVNGGTLVPVPLKRERRFKLDPADVEAAITPRTKIIGLTTPDTPPGAVQERTDLERIAELAIRHDLLVISDETYEKINFGATPHFSIGSLPGMEERTITINSFSKAWSMTGWRVGYAAGPPELMAPLKVMHATNCIWLNTPAQYAAIEAYRGPQEPLHEMVAEYKRRMEILVAGIQAIDGMEVFMPEGAYYLWPSIEAFKMESADFAQTVLDRANVLVGPGSGFAEDEGRYALRLSCSGPVDEIEEGVQRLAQVCQEIRAETN